MTKLDELKVALLALETPGQAQAIMEHQKHVAGVATSVHDALAKHHQGDYEGAKGAMAQASADLAQAAPVHSGLTPGQRPQNEAQWSDLFDQAWHMAKHPVKDMGEMDYGGGHGDAPVRSDTLRSNAPPKISGFGAK